jgi:hypothetical protein
MSIAPQTSYVGETCRTVVFLHRGDETAANVAKAERNAWDVLDAKCREVGLVASNLTLVSRKPCTEPYGQYEPAPHLDILTYEATAAAP